ncbi:MAG: DUF1786 domain-containing protein [Chloroflexota bacterium]|nr:DUF1786 domain-containing protein [Dehalococcoidia bacterium]MDW8254541.1 DUF1786 domain-containing protein [Chloroflexota bacterium]
MRILAVDVGTGTQDVLLFDPAREIENCLQLILPSPTVVVAERIRAATRRRDPVVLTGRQMGGGPSAWAARDHALAGLPIAATPEAATTFDDDLDRVREMGITLVSEEEAARLPGVHLRLGDIDRARLLSILAAYDVPPPEGWAAAVFDHGAAPPGVSDRAFRFDYLASRIDEGLTGLGFLAAEIPPQMSRLRAVAAELNESGPLLVMDTGPAAVLGALDDPAVCCPGIVANLGNFHTLAYALDEDGIAGLFEHHTGELTAFQLERLLRRLADGTLTNREVFESQGHGAIVRRSLPRAPLAITGPRRALLAGSALQPYLAVPHGAMMLAGCFGLLRAWAAKDAAVREQVERRLGPGRPLKSVR